MFFQSKFPLKTLNYPPQSKPYPKTTLNAYPAAIIKIIGKNNKCTPNRLLAVGTLIHGFALKFSIEFYSIKFQIKKLTQKGIPKKKQHRENTKIIISKNSKVNTQN